VLCHCHSNQSHKWIEVWVINRNRFDLEISHKICIAIQIVWIQITPCLRISPQHARFVCALNTEGSLTWKEQRRELLCMPGCFLCLHRREWNKMLMLQAWCRFSVRVLLCFHKDLDCKFHLPLTVLLSEAFLNTLLFRIKKLDEDLSFYFSNAYLLVLEGCLRRQNHIELPRNHIPNKGHFLKRFLLLSQSF